MTTCRSRRVHAHAALAWATTECADVTATRTLQQSIRSAVSYVCDDSMLDPIQSEHNPTDDQPLSQLANFLGRGYDKPRLGLVRALSYGQ